MAHTVTIDPGSRVGTVTFEGMVTGTEMLEACHTLIGDADWRPGFGEVWDLLDAEVDVGPAEISDLVASTHRLSDRIGQNQVAIVTTREAVGTLVRLFELFTIDLGRSYLVVPTRREAAEWLGVPVDALHA